MTEHIHKIKSFITNENNIIVVITASLMNSDYKYVADILKDFHRTKTMKRLVIMDKNKYLDKTDYPDSESAKVIFSDTDFRDIPKMIDNSNLDYGIIFVSDVTDDLEYMYETIDMYVVKRYIIIDTKNLKIHSSNL